MPRAAVSPSPSGRSPTGSPAANDSITVNGGANGGARRSGRTTKRPVAYQDPDSEDELFANPVSPPTKKVKIVMRRNPPREAAAEPAYAGLSLPSEDEVLEEAFLPLTAQERETWTGWTEVESEPSYFNIILQELGIQHAKMQEVFGNDEYSFGILPKPVYGIIFLYRIREDDEDEEARVDCPSGIWFANQTTADACATVAMVNIAMNAEDITLGEVLEKFKAETKDLNPALRGHLLSFNDKIRTAHNSFARRMDILNSDLSLKNAVDDEPKTKKAARKSPAKKATKVKTAAKDAAFHYIAYVPIDGHVWELDGMHGKPLCLGAVPAPPDDGDDPSHADDGPDDPAAAEPREAPWVQVARERITERMTAYESADNRAEFNLLALCRSRLNTLVRRLACNIKTLEHCAAAAAAAESAPGWEASALCSRTSAALAEYKLTPGDVDAARVPRRVLAQTDGPGFGAAEAAALRDRLLRDHHDICGAIADELVSCDEDASRAESGKKDYAPAIHVWLKALARGGHLEGLMDQAGLLP